MRRAAAASSARWDHTLLTCAVSGPAARSSRSRGAPLEDVSAPDDLMGKLPVNNMWARSFVRLARDLVRTIGGAAPEGAPATFRDGWIVQRVLDAVRAGVAAPLD